MRTKTPKSFTKTRVWVASYEINPDRPSGEYYDCDWACWFSDFDDAKHEAENMAAEYAKLLADCQKNGWDLFVHVWECQGYPVANSAEDEKTDEFQDAINEWTPWDAGGIKRLVLKYEAPR